VATESIRLQRIRLHAGPGYWDYPLEERGLLNAPVYIDQQFSLNPNWSYTPQYSIGMGDGDGWGNGGAFNSMYIGPNYNNYYYGNYSDPSGLGGFGFRIGQRIPPLWLRWVLPVVVHRRRVL